MATSYSTLLGLALPTTGELAGTWGDTVNNYITQYLDSAVAGTQTLSTDADVTLTKTTNAALGSTSSQYAILNCTGARTALRTITAPAASKYYLVINGTTGGFGVKVVGAGPTTGVTIANGKAALIAWNGSDFVTVASNDASVITGILGVANGGTGLSSGTSGGVLYYSGTNTLASSAALAANALVIGGGAGVAPSTTTTGAGILTFLGTPSSANLAAAVTDETGSGSLVFATSPSLTTPTLGVASATSINKVALTAPATSATLTIADGKTLTASNSLTLAGTDSTTMTFPPASASVGYLNIPINSQSAAYTTVLADAGKTILHPSTDNNARTFTIDSNANVAYATGTAITFINMANTLTIAITSDTMYLAGAGTTGSRTLATYGMATAVKLTSTTWIISGNGLS